MSSLIRTAALSVLLVPLAGIAPAQPSGSAGAGPGYRSVFEGYRGFTDQPVQPWRESNDVVGRIGGWQAYAREAQGGAAPGGTAPAAGAAPASMSPAASSPGPSSAPLKMPPSKATPPAAPASGAPTNGHSGHMTR